MQLFNSNALKRVVHFTTPSFVVALLLFSGCQHSEPQTVSQAPESVSPFPKLEDSVTLKFKSADGLAKTATQTSAKSINGESVPLLFGQIGVSAYHYRPNQTHQMGIGSFDGYSTWNSNNWSRWQMLALNSSGARDFVLPSGGNLDISKMAGNSFFSDVTQDYVENVGAFRFDAVSIYGAAGLINNQNSLCGPWYLAVKSPADFPALSFNSPCATRDVFSSFDGTRLWGQQTLFVRNDWFPSPIQVHIYSNSGSKEECFTTNVPLTDFQTEIFDSLLYDINTSQGWTLGSYRNSCAGMSQHPYDISIIPLSTNVGVIKFKHAAEPHHSSMTPSGHLIPTPQTPLAGKSIEVNLEFNLLRSMIVNLPAFDNSSDTSPININPATNGSIWGTAIKFNVKDRDD